MSIPVIRGYVTDHVSDHWPDEFFKEHILELADGRGVLRQAGCPDVLFPSFDAAMAAALGTPHTADWLIEEWEHGYPV